MATFGHTGIGANEDFSTASNSRGSKFTAPANGTISKISVYVSSYFSSSNLRVAIYSDVAGVPTTKLAESGSATSVTGGNQWYDVNISLAITSGTVYWLVFWSSGADFDSQYDTPGDVSNQGTFDSTATYPTWDDPYIQGFALDRKYSVYATYTASGGVVVPYYYDRFVAGRSGGF